jgi:DNA-binding SARP family transcriptional activator/TolB-like protein/Tfp pilus assembly protein PilF
MIDFRTLGAAELEENSGSGARPIAVQAKRLALVAYLALAGRGRQRRRDSIVALFWPDLDEEHARSALRQALSYLRRTLGASAILTRGEEEVAVAREAIRCDAVLFDEAIAAGRLEAAAALYRGDFLDGLFVADGSPELEQWIDSERARRRQTAATCAWSLAEACRQRGDGVAAAEWGRRAVSLAPADESTLRGLIGLLDSIGDRAGAVDAYERFARRLASEYAAEPSAETKALMSAVRNRSVASSDPTTLTSLPSTRERTPWATDSVGPLARRPSSNQPIRRTALAITFTAALALVVAVGSAAFLWTARPPRATMAVLPTEDLDADTSQPYLADVLTDQLIAELARSRELQVINGRTMMAYRRSPKRPRDIARELDADAVLIPSVRRSGDSLRLTGQLVRAGDDRISWVWSSQASGGDLLRLAERMADSVAGLTLGRRRIAEGRRGNARGVDQGALDLYAQGRYWWNKRGPGLLRAIDIFTQALDRDATFALAYAGIADAYVQLGYGSLLRPDDAFLKARAAAERALQYDSTLAEPHATLGFVKMYYDWDWTGAEREFRRALALNPSYATAHEWYGLFLSAMGRFEEARDHERRAQVLDPLSTAVAGTAAWVLYYAGRFDDADRELRVALRADSSFSLGRFYLGRVHEARGHLDSALAEYQAVSALRDWVPTIAAVGHVYGSQGRKREALATLSRLDSLSNREYVTAYAVALVHASLGQRDSAFAWLERGIAERTHWLVWLRRDPRWSAIRTDPRFERLATRLKLPA